MGGTKAGVTGGILRVSPRGHTEGASGGSNRNEFGNEWFDIKWGSTPRETGVIGGVIATGLVNPPKWGVVSPPLWFAKWGLRILGSQLPWETGILGIQN